MTKQIQQTLKNQTGSSLIAALFVVLTMSVVGMELVQLTASENANAADSIQSTQAFFVGQAGLERTVAMTRSGNNPTISNMPFNGGHFSATPDYATNRTTVTSSVGIAARTQSIETPFAASCTRIVTDNVVVHEKELRHLALEKSCDQVVVVDKVTFSWSWPGYSNENAYIEFVPMDWNSKLYRPQYGYGVAPAQGQAKNGVEIDGVNKVLTENRMYEFEYMNNTPEAGVTFQNIPTGCAFLPVGGQYTVRVTFLDGSSTSASFTI